MTDDEIIRMLWPIALRHPVLQRCFREHHFHNVPLKDALAYAVKGLWEENQLLSSNLDKAMEISPVIINHESKNEGRGSHTG